jgi:tetratricopeptide (TPR) repeat protein
MSALLEELAEAPEVRPGPGIGPGTVIGGRFEVLRELGRGGFGVVFEARDRELGRLVAVKVVRARRGVDPGMLRGEAEAAAALHHPNIVTVHDLGSSGGEGWLVLELLRGETLEARLHRGPLPGPEALRVATEIARGLAHAHHAGVLHRDLKPSNVFLCDDGAVKILDFGLSRVFGSGSGPEGGTPAYMAPEQWRREAEDERTDVFALGVMLHEMLTGHRPFAVESGRSTALDDGPVPHLPAGAATRNLRALIRRSMSRSRDDRPRDGAVVLETLLHQRAAADAGRTRRRVVLAGALVGLVALLALLASRVLQVRDLAPGQRIPVAVADFQNGTSDPELNGLSGMLTTSLEQSKRLTVLTRSRLADLLRQMGKDVPERIDESLAREVGKAAGLKALLLATVHRFDDLYAIEMRALDPATNEYLFTLKEEGRGKASVPAMIDRLSALTRERLRERPADLAGGRGIADVTTASLAAYEHYFKARQALDLRRFDQTRDELLSALRIDPQFALAHYQMAVLDAWTVMRGSGDEAQVRDAQAHLENAVKLADRLPEKERLGLLAWKATWENRLGEALRIRDDAADRFPQDKEAVFWAGDIRFHMGDSLAAIPYFERALQLDPDYALVEEHIVLALSAVDRRPEQLEWARRWAESSREPQAYRAMGRALLANGRRDEAVEAFRQASARDGLFAVSPALAAHLSFHGRAHEAEAEVRSALRSLPAPKAAAPDDPRVDVSRLERVSLTRGLGDALVYQGRLREAREFLQGLEASGLPPRDCAGIRMGFAFATRSPDDVRGAVQAFEKTGALKDGGAQAEAALALAVAGDIDASRSLADAAFASAQAAEFPSFVRPFYEAIVAWRKGNLADAEVGLRAVAEGPYLDARYKALSILGEIEVGRGRYASAVEALERARAIPFAPQIGGLPFLQANGLYHLAVAYDRLGDPAKARDRVQELLRFWRRADADAPNVAEARALARKLGAQATQR